ncbi:MAG: hypothetical protein BGO95_02585 [Micrococcales bacterium 73-13]|nr:MAG: hypothetical protein BGO95_02585 [Micrococcales bacterium 73-13]
MGRDDARAASGVARITGLLVSFSRGPYGLAAGFAALHLAYALALLPIMLRGGTEGDLPLYRTWAMQTMSGHGPVFDEPWVYPAGALLPIVLALLAGRGGYLAVWLVIMTALNAAAVLTLTRRLRDRRAYPAAWWFLLFEFLLAPVALLRLEAVTVPLAIMALALVVRRPAVAGALIAAAAWVKVWPVSLAVSAFVVSRRRWAIALGGLAMSAAVALVVVLGGGGPNLLSFVTVQSDRALQLEAPIATPWVWGAVLGGEGYRIFEDLRLATREVAGPGATEAAEAIGVAMMLACVVVVALLVVARLRLRRLGPDAGGMEPRLLLLGALALTAALIALNKVGSPQYMLWLVPIVVAGLAVDRARWRGVALWLAAISLLTTMVFPILYMPLVEGEPFAAIVLTLRNVLVVLLFLAATGRLALVAIDPARLLPRAVPARVPASVSA